MFENSFSSSREYSKAHAQNDRDQLAVNLRAKRTADRALRTRGTERTRDSIDRGEADCIRLKKKIDELTEIVDYWKTQLELSLWQKIAWSKNSKNNYIETIQTPMDSDRAKLMAAYGTLRSTESDLLRSRTKMREYDDFLVSQRRQEMRDMLEEFHRDIDQKWETYEIEQFQEQERARQIEEELPKRTVEHMCTENEVYFVHATMPDFLPQGNSKMHGNPSWQDKVRAMIALEPAVSCSSFRLGEDSYKRLFHSVGVLLKSGRIDAVYTEDGGTQAGLYGRFGHDGQSQHNPPSLQKVQEVIMADSTPMREGMNHNEIAVAEPKVASLYVLLEDISFEPKNKFHNIPPHHEIKSLGDELGLPVYGLVGDSFYKTRYDDTSQSYVSIGEVVDPKSLPDHVGVLGATRDTAFCELADRAGEIYDPTSVDIIFNSKQT